MKHPYLIFGEKKVEIPAGKELSIGRVGYGADVEINDPLVSRKHAIIKKQNSGIFIRDLGSVNGISINGKKIEPEKFREISNGDIINIINEELKLIVEPPEIDQENKPVNHKPSIGINNKFHDTLATSRFKQKIQRNEFLTIGRLQDNDLVIDDPTVSRRHARITYEGNEFWITDLGSKNKTYLNGKEIKGKTKLNDNDVVTISFYSINLLEGFKDLKNQKFAISAAAIQKTYPNGKIGLQTLNLDIEKSSFIALMGPSGCGKSTLLKCLNGENPATEGNVYIHSLSIAEHFNLIKKKIGYVPQDDIIHKELSVYKTLYYAAKLRLPDDTEDEEIERRIDRVIKDLNLDQDKKKDIRNIAVGDLSGGQRKRISIAVELLTEPTILFLDEPTSPLDPETIENFLKSLQSLAKKGTTIIMVTHKPEDLNYVDQVVFLGVRGHITYKGKAELLVPYFKVENIVEVYSKMSDPNQVSAFYLKPEKEPALKSDMGKIKKDKPDNSFLQFYWLSTRYLKIKAKDKQNLILLMAQPIIIAGLVCLVFNQLRIGVLFLMTISAIWFGVSNAAKEIVGELNVYKRERMFNLKIHTYILSKCLVLSGIALIQTLIFVIIIYFNFRYAAVEEFDHIFLKSFGASTIFMFYIALSSTLIGLLLSAYFTSTEKVMTVVPITLMPQILLAGVMTKIDSIIVEILSFTTFGRWGTEGLARIQDNAYSGEESLLSPVPPFMGQGADTECNCQPIKALETLDLYNENLVEEGKLIGSIFNSLEANILVITCINILVYIFIYYSLKRKDSL
ncbi:MAG TPA: FHA domain-containing protein [Salinimicrobium sp.]|nr:FHA domain-containing protein [Salinimicrobium sp.]